MKSEEPQNIVQISIHTEMGCDPEEGEYSMFISGLIGALDLSAPGNPYDIQLIKEAIEDDLDFDKLPTEGSTEVILKESGEWEDVFWNKYYVIESVTVYVCWEPE